MGFCVWPQNCTKCPKFKINIEIISLVRAISLSRRRRRRRPGGHTTAVGSEGRRAPISTDTASHTHTARSLACPLLTLSSAPILQRHFQVPWRARVPPPRVLLPHTCTQDGWFLQPKRRPSRLPRRAVPSDCICRCSRIRVRLPLHILLHTQVSR